jgi:hypothetical protein
VVVIKNFSSIFVPIFAISVAGCSQTNATTEISTDRFGVSYDDCILRSVKAGLSTESVDLIRKACVHAWEQESEEFAAVETTMTEVGGAPEISFSVENTGKNIARRVQIGVQFESKPKPQKLYWTFSLNLEPGQSVDLPGTFVGNKAPSSEFNIIASDTQFIRILAIRKAAVTTASEESSDD